MRVLVFTNTVEPHAVIVKLRHGAGNKTGKAITVVNAVTGNVMFLKQSKFVKIEFGQGLLN